MEIQRQPSQQTGYSSRFRQQLDQNLRYCEYLSYIRIKKDQNEDFSGMGDLTTKTQNKEFASKHLDHNQVSALMGQLLSIQNMCLLWNYRITNENLFWDLSTVSDSVIVIRLGCSLQPIQEAHESIIKSTSRIMDDLFKMVQKCQNRNSQGIREYQRLYKKLQDKPSITEGEFLRQAQQFDFIQARSKLYLMQENSVQMRICQNRQILDLYSQELKVQRNLTNSQLYLGLRNFLQSSFPCKAILKIENTEQLLMSVTIKWENQREYSFEVDFRREKSILVVKLNTNIYMVSQFSDSYEISLNFLKETTAQFASEFLQTTGQTPNQRVNQRLILIRRATKCLSGQPLLRRLLEMIDLLVAIRIVLALEDETFKTSKFEVDRIQMKLADLPAEMQHYAGVMRLLSEALHQLTNIQ